MIFLTLLFGALCPKKDKTKLLAALLLGPRFLNFGASHFFIGNGALFALGPALKQETKNSEKNRRE
jgi:hypothetical protein